MCLLNQLNVEFSDTVDSTTEQTILQLHMSMGLKWINNVVFLNN